MSVQTVVMRARMAAGMVCSQATTVAFSRSGSTASTCSSPVFGLGADDGHKVAMAFEERNLVDAHGRERRRARPNQRCWQSSGRGCRAAHQ